MRRWLLVGVLFLATQVARGDGPQDNIPENVRRIPKLGIEVADSVRQELTTELAQLDALIQPLRQSEQPNIRDLVPDVLIFWQAVHDALTYQEFFVEKELDVARDLLREGRERAEQLSRGEAPWTTATGLVVRGYESRIDGSVQPYGLVIPSGYASVGTQPVRLDLWFHGRGETLSEVSFLDQRRKQVGTFAPPDAIVLHPYGRYSNANKFAGEIDVLEALASVQSRYRIDEERIVVRGFSMGGASTWQLAVHYPGRWAAANPGAGFSETPEFLRTFQNETLRPTWWEQKLWHLYDCTDWAGNLRHCPTVAYSGELDKQKQAADIMAQALGPHGLELVHVVGPETGHKYHPDSAREVERRITALARLGRERVPTDVDFTTYTLRYHQLAWLSIEGLDEHWAAARVKGRLGAEAIRLDTSNVQALSLVFEPGEFSPPRLPRLEIRDQPDQPPQVLLPRDLPPRRTDRSWRVDLHRDGDRWVLGNLPDNVLRKRPGLQGPIDDAFMDAFLFVRPTGKCQHPDIEAWTHSELQRAVEHWRRHFRGHPRIKDDRDVTDEDLATRNIVLWGDAAANQLLARMVERLPIVGQRDALRLGDQSFDAAHHVPILIYPNPLNPDRYVVLNSSFTFRDYAYLNNARQVPMLPDWAVVDVRTPANSVWPGKVVTAGFFDERWRLKAE